LALTRIKVENIDSSVPLGNEVDQTVSLNTTASTDQVVIDTFDKTVYRTTKYLVQMTAGTDYHSTEMLVIHDGTTAYLTEYAAMYDNTLLSSFDVDISGDDVRLLATPASSTSTSFKIFKTLIKL